MSNRVLRNQTVTFTAAKNRIQAMGMRLTNTGWGDYRVAFRHAKPGDGYFTTDLQDAIDTAAAMKRAADERAAEATRQQQEASA